MKPDVEEFKKFHELQYYKKIQGEAEGEFNEPT